MSPLPADRAVRVFDAQGKVLGRLATEIASALRGKDVPTWRPNRDPHQTVVVWNTDSVRFTGRKLETKRYHTHTQRKPGAQRTRTLKERFARDSREVLRDAVWNMLPKNRLRHREITRLKLFRSAAPHGDPAA